MSEYEDIDVPQNSHTVFSIAFIFIYVVLSMSIFIMTGMLLSKGSSEKLKLWLMYAGNMLVFIITTILLISKSSKSWISLFAITQFFIGIMMLEEAQCRGNLEGLDATLGVPVPTSETPPPTGETPPSTGETPPPTGDTAPPAISSTQTKQLLTGSYITNGILLFFSMLYIIFAKQ